MGGRDSADMALHTSTTSSDESDVKRGRGEVISHKVIEKRRRDRINNCLAELSQTVPAAFAKQSSGKLEKAEILEMTVEYLRAVHSTGITSRLENAEWIGGNAWSENVNHHYQAGYSECIREVVRYLEQVEGRTSGDVRSLRIVTFLRSQLRPQTSTMSLLGPVYQDFHSSDLPIGLPSSSTKCSKRTRPALSGSDVFSSSQHRYTPYSSPVRTEPNQGGSPYSVDHERANFSINTLGLRNPLAHRGTPEYSPANTQFLQQSPLFGPVLQLPRFRVNSTPIVRHNAFCSPKFK